MNCMRVPAMITGVILFGLSCSHDSVAGCEDKSAEEVGTDLGHVILEIAHAFVNAEVWSDPNCSSPSSDEVRYLCSLLDDVEQAVERINEALAQGCINEFGDYGQSADYYAFQVLENALSSPEPRLRWQVLMRMFLLCKDAVMLTDAGARGCGSVIERASLEVLRQEEEPFNRHLALEILNSRFATDSSLEVLAEVEKSGRSIGAMCPHGFRSAGSTQKNYLPWDEIARGFAESKFGCEKQLAREALDRVVRE